MPMFILGVDQQTSFTGYKHGRSGTNHWVRFVCSLIDMQVSCDKFWHLLNILLTFYIELTLTSLTQTRLPNIIHRKSKKIIGQCSFNNGLIGYGKLLDIWPRKIPIWYSVQFFKRLNCLIEYPFMKLSWKSNTFITYVFSTSDPMPKKVIPTIIVLCAQPSVSGTMVLGIRHP